MKLSTEILRAVNGSSYPRTNFGLAEQLYRPQPSVRRATRILTEMGLLTSESTSYGPEREFRITPEGVRAARAAV